MHAEKFKTSYVRNGVNIFLYYSDCTRYKFKKFLYLKKIKIHNIETLPDKPSFIATP